MKPIREVYPDISYGYISDYHPLLASMGYDILLKVDDKGYQGDSYLIFKNGRQRGLLVFGWGSCSGCDALQACDSYEEVDELRTKLLDKIQWFPSKNALLAHINNKDWEVEYMWHDEGFRSFLKQARELLK